MAEDLILKQITEIKNNASKHNRDDDVRFEKNDKQNQAILKSIDQLLASHSELVLIVQEANEKMKPMAGWFTEMNVGKKIKWAYISNGTKIAGFIGAVLVVLGALWTGIKFIISQALLK